MFSFHYFASLFEGQLSWPLQEQREMYGHFWRQRVETEICVSNEGSAAHSALGSMLMLQ